MNATGERIVRTLIDTGTSINFINEQWFNKLNSLMNLHIVTCELSIKVANGQIIRSKGKVKLPKRIAKQEAVVECHIIPQLTHYFILGCQFLRKHQAIIDFSELKPVINLNIIDPSIPKLHTIVAGETPGGSLILHIYKVFIRTESGSFTTRLTGAKLTGLISAEL